MEELTGRRGERSQGERKGGEGRRKQENDNMCEDEEKKRSKGRRLDESRKK